MSKIVKIICSVIIVGLVFGGGYFAGAKINAEVMKEVRIGYQNEGNPNRVDYHKVYTDLENPEIIDSFLMIYFNREKIENVSVDLQNPDLYIELNNPKYWIGMMSSEIWFTDEGAIMGDGAGEQMMFYEIDEGDAEYIKTTIGYEEE